MEGTREPAGDRASILLLILFRTAKFSIQHVSPKMEGGRGGGGRKREIQGERGRLTVARRRGAYTEF